MTVRTSDAPSGLVEGQTEEIELLVVPGVIQATGDLVIFMGRPPGSEFTSREIARVQAIIAIHDRIQRPGDRLGISDRYPG